jgi:hypothetical protein
MGALTLKSFPFELRGWDIEKFESLDPTDSFGSNTRVYINKDQIVVIEPDYNVSTFNTWLTDKGRQFFDGIFGACNTISKNDPNTKKHFWLTIFRTILESVYVFDHCNQQQINKKFFTIVFENLSLEVINLLLIIGQNYSFIKLKRAENFKIDNDYETDFQLNIASDRIKLHSSTFCILVSTNPRYEGYYLNLSLRQRFLKGNFKCLTVGSLIDLSFPLTFLGSNVNILKAITEGNSLVCQDFRSAKNPIIIYNNELFKRNDGHNMLKILKILNYSNNFNNFWNGLNMLSSSLSENGNHISTKFSGLTLKDLNNFSVLYFINVTTNSVTNLKKITELNILNYSLNATSKIKNKLIVDQNFKTNNNESLFNKIIFNENQFKPICNYHHVPTSVFFENEETFINTEGFFKRTVKLISKKKTKNNWQILRKLFKDLKKKFVSLNKKSNEFIYFNSNRLINFKNFSNFQFHAVQSLTNLNFYLTVKTNPVFFHQNSINFRIPSNKIQATKLKYWLDDFFTSGKDEYSQNSLILTNCSRVLRIESTNFF